MPDNPSRYDGLSRVIFLPIDIITIYVFYREFDKAIGMAFSTTAYSNGRIFAYLPVIELRCPFSQKYPTRDIIRARGYSGVFGANNSYFTAIRIDTQRVHL